MAVEILLPGALADLIGGTRHLAVELPQPATVGGLLEALGQQHPVLHRRLCDETGALRRFVNVYVDGDDVRRNDGLQTAVHEASTVQILPSVAGGAIS
jgi:molybdopterin synthase sulfur carrier subunit